MDKVAPGRFRVGILGAGGISDAHIAVIGRLPNASVSAVCDLSPERGRALARRHGIENAFVSTNEMLEQVRPDVVHVLLPPAAHAQAAIQCLQAGSHVFVEKPLGMTVSECAELKRVAVAKGLAVGVNHNMLYRSSVQQLIELIRTERFGRLVHVNIAWSMPPEKVRNAPDNKFFLQAPENVLLEWAVHPLSIVRRLMGRPIRARSLVSEERQVRNGCHFYGSWQSSLQCERGTAQLLLSVGEAYDCCWINVLGEDAFAHVDIVRDTLLVSEHKPFRPAIAGFVDAMTAGRSLLSSAARNAGDYVRAGLGRPVPGNPFDSGMHASIKAFYEALARGERPPEGVDEGMAVIEYCDAVFANAFPASSREAA